MDGSTANLIEETRWVREARLNNPAGWEALVRMHQEAVFRYAYLLCGDPDEAEDIAQEAFIRAYRALHRFDEGRPLKPWLLRITANLAHNYFRSAGRYLAALRRLGLTEPEPVIKVDEKAVQNLQSHSLHEAIRRLPGDDQKIIYLRYFLDLSVEDAATAAQIASGTVKSRLHRALNRLRHLIQREYPQLLGLNQDE